MPSEVFTCHFDSKCSALSVVFLIIIVQFEVFAFTLSFIGNICRALSLFYLMSTSSSLFWHLYIHETSVNKGNTAVWFRDVSMFCEHLHVAPSGGQP